MTLSSSRTSARARPPGARGVTEQPPTAGGVPRFATRDITGPVAEDLRRLLPQPPRPLQRREEPRLRGKKARERYRKWSCAHTSGHEFVAGTDDDEDDRERRRRKRPRYRDGENEEDVHMMDDLSSEKALQCRVTLAEINRKLSMVISQP